MHEMYVKRDLRKYCFLDPFKFNIHFQQKGEKNIKMYIQNSLVDEQRMLLETVLPCVSIY